MEASQRERGDMGKSRPSTYVCMCVHYTHACLPFAHNLMGSGILGGPHPIPERDIDKRSQCDLVAGPIDSVPAPPASIHRSDKGRVYASLCPASPYFPHSLSPHAISILTSQSLDDCRALLSFAFGTATEVVLRSSVSYSSIP